MDRRKRQYGVFTVFLLLETLPFGNKDHGAP